MAAVGHLHGSHRLLQSKERTRRPCNLTSNLLTSNLLFTGIGSIHGSIYFDRLLVVLDQPRGWAISRPAVLREPRLRRHRAAAVRMPGIIATTNEGGQIPLIHPTLGSFVHLNVSSILNDSISPGAGTYGTAWGMFMTGTPSMLSSTAPSILLPHPTTTIRSSFQILQSSPTAESSSRRLEVGRISLSA